METKKMLDKNGLEYYTGKIKQQIPKKTSDLTNDSNFIDNTYHDSSKQDTLVSGINIKTINNASILGNGNIEIDVESMVSQAVSNALLTAHPVGSIEINITGTNPSKYLGGEWKSFGSGRTLVGVNTSDTSFNTVEKTGGEKTHTLTIKEMPSHNHNRAKIKYTNQFLGPAGGSNANVAGINLNSGYYPYTNETENNVEVSNTGGGQAHNNLQPYITVYFWKRIN